MAENYWRCPRCGMVRSSTEDWAPWCRHFALDLPAARMRLISESQHAIYDDVLTVHDRRSARELLSEGGESE